MADCPPHPTPQSKRHSDSDADHPQDGGHQTPPWRKRRSRHAGRWLGGVCPLGCATVAKPMTSDVVTGGGKGVKELGGHQGRGHEREEQAGPRHVCAAPGGRSPSGQPSWGSENVPSVYFWVCPRPWVDPRLHRVSKEPNHPRGRPRIALTGKDLAPEGTLAFPGVG